MANNIIKRVWNQNKMANIEDLSGFAFQAEDGGHTFEISGIDGDGNTVALSGSVAGVFRRPDNADIALTGAASDGVASVTLTDDCYAVPGRAGLTIFVTSGGQKVAVYAAALTVTRTSGGAVAGDTPQDVVDLINAIEAAVATIPADYTDLMESIAPMYSNSALYPVGAYAWHDGVLYRCTTPITTAETWTAAHWTVADITADVSTIIAETNMGYEVLPFTHETGKLVRYATGVVASSEVSNATGFIDVSQYKRLVYKRAKTTATSAPAAGMAFYNESKTYISGLGTAYNQDADGYMDQEISVPEGAKYARFTFYQDSTLGTFGVQGEIQINNYVTQLSSDLEDLREEVVPEAYPFTYTNGMYVYHSDGTRHSSSNFSCTDFIPLNGAAKILYSRMKVTSSDPAHGMAFYSSDDVSGYISGVASSGGNDAMGSELYEVDVPATATYARFSWFSEALRETYGDFALYDAEEYAKTLDGLDARVTKLEEEIDQGVGYTALLSEAIQSEGVQAAVLRARQFSDIRWTPVADMPGIKKNLTTGVYDYVPFKKGVRQKGIPYSRVDADKRIANAVSFDCFATVVLNPNSYIYTTNIYSAENKRATAYGVVCSKLVQYAWGCPEIYDSQEIEKLPGLTKIASPGQWDENDIKVGDGVLNPQVHCAICTDVLRDPYGVVRAIEITEAITPQCVRRVWTIPEFFEYFGTYGLYRYQYIDDAVYEKSPYIDLEDGLTGETDIPIAIRRGSYCVVPLNATRAADVDNTKWTTMHVLHNGTETTTAINASTINVPTSEHGYYEVWPTDASNNRGNSSFYYVEDTPTITSSVSGSTLSLTYSADCPASYVQWTGSNTKFTFLGGTGSEDVTIPSGATAFKIAFKSKYGIWWSSSTSLL